MPNRVLILRGILIMLRYNAGTEIFIIVSYICNKEGIKGGDYAGGSA